MERTIAGRGVFELREQPKIMLAMRKLIPVVSLAIVLAVGTLPSVSARKFYFGKRDSDSLQVLPSQPKPISLELGFTFKSQHIWNGMVSYDSWNVQPDLTFSAYGFFLNAWACMPVLRKVQNGNSLLSDGEIDLSIGYDYKGIFTISYIDFYYPPADKRDRPDFFRWKTADEGAIHQQFAMISFNGVEKFPLEITVGAFTFGDTRMELGSDGVPVAKEQYSMYIGLGYTHTLKTGQTLSYQLGGTPYKGFFDSRSANITNVTFSVTQPIKITEYYTVPLKLDLVLNPAYEKLWFVAAIGLF